jgi:hypothetical protein
LERLARIAAVAEEGTRACLAASEAAGPVRSDAGLDRSLEKVTREIAGLAVAPMPPGSDGSRADMAACSARAICSAPDAEAWARCCMLISLAPRVLEWEARP